MTTLLDIHRFAALKQAFKDVCEAPEHVRSERLCEIALRDPALARELGQLLDSLEPADLHPPDEKAALARLQFGPFQVLRRIGTGGMGEVFLAQRTDQGFVQQVALKRVHALARSPESTRRFLRERQLLARLDHPGIARLVDGGVSADERPWLAMEFVDGSSLLAHARAQALDTRARVQVFRGVCAAVAFAHRHLIVHRDIKPANVMVTADGQTKLLDFGIAKLLDVDDAEQTQQGSRMLTLRYAAPEQVAGEASTTATDIYALGLLLYELVAGCSPYVDAVSSGNWGRAALAEAPHPLVAAMLNHARGNPSLRRELTELDRITRKAMAKQPAERYLDVAALDADLQDWLDRRPLRSGIGSAGAQTLFLLRRFRLPLSLAAAALLALSVGLFIARAQAQRAEHEARTAKVHLNAVLEVLGAANPGYFAGREPSASEFLLTAAKQLVASHAERPELRRRALTEIGHGLINLGKSVDAEQVLRLALAATDEDPLAQPTETLGVLALLIETQAADADRSRLIAIATRIEGLVLAGTRTTSDALDALTRAGAAMSRRAEFARADRLFALAEQVVSAPDTRASQVENYWRQRGWAALRANDGARARSFLDRADQATASAHPPLSPMRVAEGDLLQFQAALLGGDTIRARARLQAARPIYAAEFAVTHSETAVFGLHEAHLLLAESRFAEADAIALKVQTRLADEGIDYAGDRAVAHLLRATAQAALGGCGLAVVELAAGRRGVEALPTRLPRELAKLASAAAAIERHCAKKE